MISTFADNRYWAKPREHKAMAIVVEIGKDVIGATLGAATEYYFSGSADFVGGAVGFGASFIAGKALGRPMRKATQAFDFMIAGTGLDLAANMIPRFEMEDPDGAAREIVSILRDSGAVVPTYKSIQLGAAAMGHNSNLYAPGYGDA